MWQDIIYRRIIIRARRQVDERRAAEDVDNTIKILSEAHARVVLTAVPLK